MGFEGPVALLLPAENLGNQMPSANLGNAMICEATRHILKRLPARYQTEEFSFLKAPDQRELDQINNCARAVFVGTNIFQPHVVGWKWRTEDLKQIRIPYSLYGIGYSGPVGRMPLKVCRETRDLIEWSRKADAIGARDPQTVEWLKLFGANSELIGCPVLAYPDTFPGISLGEGRPLLAIREILMHNPDEESKPAQRTLVNWFFKEYPNGSCVVQERADLSLLSGKQTITDFEEIIQELSKARFVVSTRLHAGMMALAFGRPVIFIAPDTRVESFCDMMGIRSHSLTFNGLTRAVEAARRIERGDLSQLGPVTDRLDVFVRRLHYFLEQQMTGARTKKMRQPSIAVTLLRQARARLLNSQTGRKVP